jgi:thiamine pyrophosphokinase
MSICYIFGSLDVKEFNFCPDENDFIIAADKGILNTEKFGLKPNYIVGDFDSLEYVPTGENVIKHPVMKDDTDLLLAIKTGFDNGFKNFRIFGCIGGERLDHTIATIQAGAYVKRLGGNAIFYDGNTSLMLLKNETISLPEDSKGIISIFSYSESACVSIKGLLYELDNQTITQNHPLGVSNEFVGNKAKITVHNGTVLIIIKEN